MSKLDAFSSWMNENSKLSGSSIYKYTRAVNTVSNEMIERKVLNKSLLEMNLVEIDIAIINILSNEYFLKKNSVGNNMYSNAIKQFRYFTLESQEDDEEEKKIVKRISESTRIRQTEKDILIKARVGQGKYRSNLLNKYEGKCIVTGIDKSKLLVASHIKPWAICENNERIDTENGLLLSANIDRLFDSGLITFNDEGGMKISSFLGVANEARLHISKESKADLRATKRLLVYLEYHRDVLFVK